MKFTKLPTLALFVALLMVGLFLPDGPSGAEKAQGQPSASAMKAKGPNDETEKIDEGDKGR